MESNKDNYSLLTVGDSSTCGNDTTSTHTTNTTSQQCGVSRQSNLTYDGATGPNRGHTGIYGWRKRCLYFFILLLFLLVTINIALTVWIFRVVHFSLRGLGGVEPTIEGIRLVGDVDVLRSLYTSSIVSRSGIKIESSHDIVLNARDPNTGDITSSIVLGVDNITMFTDDFEVKDHDNTTLYRVNQHEVTYGASRLTVSGGGTFRGPVRSSHLQSLPKGDLGLEASRQVDISGETGVTMTSQNGSVNISSQTGVHLLARPDNGIISLRASYVYLPLIHMKVPKDSDKTPRKDATFQLCVCKDGRIFLEKPHVECGASNHECVDEWKGGAKVRKECKPRKPRKP